MTTKQDANVSRLVITRGGVMQVGSKTLCLFCGLLMFPAFADGQELSHSFEELQIKQVLSTGNKVRLVDHSGITTEGLVESVSGDVMALVVDGTRREVSESSVQEISRQRPDSVWNGTLIGAGVGFLGGMGFTAYFCPSDPECYMNAGLVLAPPIAAAAALVGALVDRGKHEYESVFEAVSPFQSVDIAITPVFSSEGRGMGVSFTF